MAGTKPLAKLMDELGKARERSSAAYEAYKGYKAYEDDLRQKVADALHESGLKSAKGKSYSAIFTDRPTIIIAHEQSVKDWINNTPDVEADQYIGIIPTQFQTLAKTMLKETGEMIPGTELQIKESLSIKANKKGK